MSLDGRIILAVVPARGGSKSIPRKNLAAIMGKSLIAHAAAVIQMLSWVDRAVLSTDDEEIAAEGLRAGLLVPFMRPSELADDTATSVDMWRHAWLASEQAFRTRFDVSVLMEPTSPLRSPEDVEATVRALLEGNHAAAATVSRTPAHFTPHKTLTMDDAGGIGFYLPTGARHSLRQTIPPYYHRNGICYAAQRETIVDKGMILESDCKAVIIARPVINIDEPLDLELAAFLMERQIPQ